MNAQYTPRISKKKSLQVRVSEDLATRIHKEATDHNTSAAEVIRTILEAKFDQ